MEKKEKAYLRLYEDMRTKIMNGNYEYGARIPSKRQYASEMNVAILTVEHAYDLLMEEGYIESRQRSGYYVSYREGDVYNQVVHETSENETMRMDDEALPYAMFAKTARRVLSEYGEQVVSQADGKGDIRLRSAIASYLGRARNMQVDAEQIIIGAGTEYLYTIVTSLLGRSRIYGIESPSYQKIYKVYRSQGVRIDPLKLGRHGIHTTELARTPATILHVTPYHSFPSGSSTNAAKRREYIHWVKEHEAWIVEDDYASEFTPSIKSAETLYSLSPQNVIYMNTFTKTLGSSIRVSYMVLPLPLLQQYKQTQNFRSCTVSEYIQLIITELLNEGIFERHLNKVKRKRRNQETNM